LDQSLSIVLPVHNAESTLASQILELLDVLPDLTPRFDVLIVDDGSTDQTEEVAHDLARRFPQLQVARHSRRQGAAGAVATGLQRTSGDLLFVHDGQAPVSPGELRCLWEKRDDDQWDAAGPRGRRERRDSGLIERLVAWGTALEGAAGRHVGGQGIRLIRRRASDRRRVK
jgi:glycosyltransferase involved in cell wall biosynthesis